MGSQPTELRGAPTRTLLRPDAFHVKQTRALSPECDGLCSAGKARAIDSQPTEPRRNSARTHPRPDVFHVKHSRALSPECDGLCIAGKARVIDSQPTEPRRHSARTHLRSDVSHVEHSRSSPACHGWCSTGEARVADSRPTDGRGATRGRRGEESVGDRMAQADRERRHVARHELNRETLRYPGHNHTLSVGVTKETRPSRSHPTGSSSPGVWFARPAPEVSASSLPALSLSDSRLREKVELFHVKHRRRCGSD